MDIKSLITQSHKHATDKGWWEEPVKSFPEQAMLFVTEISEAVEHYREGREMTEIFYVGDSSDNLKPDGIPIELADVVIRIADTCGRYGIDLEEAIERKMLYNQTRSHRHGGKKL